MTQEQLEILQAKTRELKNPKLLEIMRKLKEKAPEPPTPEENIEYLEALLSSRLIAPVHIRDVKEDDNKFTVDFAQLTNKKNEKYIMTFTDIETLELNLRSDGKAPVLGVTYKDLAGMLASVGGKITGFVINPFTENLIVGPAQAEVIGKYIRHKQVEKGDAVMIRELEGIPEEITDSMERYFNQRKDVKKAYLVSMIKGKETSRLVIVDTEEGVDFQEFAKDFSKEVLQPINDPEVPFMVMDYSQEAAKIATKEKVPFYVKV